MPRPRTLAALAFAALCGPFAAPAQAVELNYKWKAGDVHRFRYQEDTRFKLPAVAGLALGGLAGSSGALNIQVRSTFAEKVLQARADGSANVELRIEQLEVVQGSGAPVNALAALPEVARTVRAVVDRKGHVKPERAIVIYQHEGRYFLGAQISAGAGSGGVSASASASATLPDGQKVEVYAALDLQSGKVSGGVRAAGNAVAARAVKISPDDPALDVLPRRLFDLLVLPDGDIAPGSTTEAQIPVGTIRISCASLEGAVAPLRFQTAVAAAASSEGADKATATGDTSGLPGGGLGGIPGGGLGGIPGGGLGGIPGGAPGGTPGGVTGGFPGGEQAVGSGLEGEGEVAGGGHVVGGRVGGRPGDATRGGGISTGLQFDMDLRSRFETAAGKLLEVKGTVHTANQLGNAAGVGGGVTVDSTITLTRL